MRSNASCVSANIGINIVDLDIRFQEGQGVNNVSDCGAAVNP